MRVQVPRGALNEKDDMATLTVEELRGLGDPKVDDYLERQAKLNNEMETYRLMHIADSFGRPGSHTTGGVKWSAADLRSKCLQYEFVLYCLVKGYAQPQDYAHIFE
jgi:hypothetical protein